MAHSEISYLLQDRLGLQGCVRVMHGNCMKGWSGHKIQPLHGLSLLLQACIALASLQGISVSKHRQEGSM